MINGSLFKEETMVVYPESIEIGVQFNHASFACGRKIFLMDNGFESAVILVIKHFSGILIILPVASKTVTVKIKRSAKSSCNRLFT